MYFVWLIQTITLRVRRKFSDTKSHKHSDDDARTMKILTSHMNAGMQRKTRKNFIYSYFIIILFSYIIIIIITIEDVCALQ